MTGPLWLPGATRVSTPHKGGIMAGGPPRMVHHITWDRLKPRPSFANVRDYLVRVGYEPHLIVDPFTGTIAQFLPADRSAYALRHAGPESNRRGTVCLQVEWYFSPGLVVDGKRYDTLDDTPMRGLDRVLAWADAWGIPRTFPAGALTWQSDRDADIWATRAGHYGHSQVPGNTHTDPGPLTLPELTGDDVMTPEERKLLIETRKIVGVTDSRVDRLTDLVEQLSAKIDAQAGRAGG